MVHGSHTHQGGELFTVELSQFRKFGHQGGGRNIAEPWDTLEQLGEGSDIAIAPANLKL